MYVRRVARSLFIFLFFVFFHPPFSTTLAYCELVGFSVRRNSDAKQIRAMTRSAGSKKAKIRSRIILSAESTFPLFFASISFLSVASFVVWRATRSGFAFAFAFGLEPSYPLRD